MPVQVGGCTIYPGDCREVLATLPERSVQCVVTSPPYWGLRDYQTATWVGGDPTCEHVAVNTTRTAWANSVPGPAGATAKNAKGRNQTKEVGGYCSACGAVRIDNQIGLESDPQEYLEKMVEVFRGVRRVLRDDGTCWVNMGDCYATGAGKVGDCPGGGAQGERWKGNRGDRPGSPKHAANAMGPHTQPNRLPLVGLKPKDLIGMPWRLAFALQADGWWLRSDIIWAKPNPMPESVTDRPTKAHEYVFLLTKRERYFYDAEAVKEISADPGGSANRYKSAFGGAKSEHLRKTNQVHTRPIGMREFSGSRNLRTVWTIPSAPFPGAHFATFPPALAERCITAGTSERGCCPDCGVPWERVVETKYDNPGNRTTNGNRSLENRSITAGFPVRLEKRTNTTGWKPTCTCPPAAPVPCTVLDPFGGAGTVGLVAERLNRRSILVELSDEYVRMAEDRIRSDGTLICAIREASV